MYERSEYDGTKCAWMPVKTLISSMNTACE